MQHNVNSSIHFKFLFILTTLFSGTWLVADIAAVKLVSIFGVTLTGGFIVFPFATLLNIVIVEVYGYKSVRQAIWSGFLLIIIFLFFIHLINIIPESPYWALDREFKAILLPETRIMLASIFSFFISDFINSYLMAKMKLRSNGKGLIRRIITTSSLAFTIDIVSFMMLAFYGTMPGILLAKLMAAAYIKKIACQIILLPFAWKLIHVLKRVEQVDIYDDDTSFNPFLLDNVYPINTVKNLKFYSKTKRRVVNVV